MKRFLVVILSLVLLPQDIWTQAVSNDGLGSSVYSERRSKVAAALSPGQCAVVFSGTYRASNPELAVPAPFTPDADFRYLTGEKFPNAVLVLFPKAIETKDGLASDFVFLPGPGEAPFSAMGWDYKGDFGKLGDSLLLRPTSQWSRFVLEILDSDRIDHILTYPVDPRDFHFSINEFALHPAEILFGTVAPRFQSTPQSTRFYNEIAGADFDEAPDLIRKVISWHKYHQETMDPILKQFSKVESEPEFEKIKTKIRGIKFDFFQLEQWLLEERRLKGADELNAIQNAVAIGINAINAAARKIEVGRSEKVIQAEADYAILGARAELSKATQVISGLSGQAVLYAQNNKPISKNGSVVIDLGVRYEGYCSHLARTFPPSTGFSAEVEGLYTKIKKFHLASLKGLKPGINPYEYGYEQLAKISMELDPLLLVSGERRRGFRDNYLGGDIYSIGLEINEEWPEKEMEKGMVLTISTVIAVPHSKKFKPKYQGVLIVMTDVVRITSSGIEWLSEDLPLEMSELKELVGEPGNGTD